MSTGLKHPATHPLHWGENETFWDVQDSLAFDEGFGYGLFGTPSNDLILTQSFTADLLKIFAEGMDFTEAESWKAAVSIAFDAIQHLHTEEQLGIGLIASVLDNLEMDTQFFNQITEIYLEQLVLTEEDSEYSISALVEQRLEPEVQVEMNLVASLLQELHLAEKTISELAAAYLDRLELVEDSEYSISTEVEQNIEFEEDMIYSLIAEIVQDLELGEDVTYKLVTLLADSLILDEEEVYELLMGWKEDLSLEDFVRLVGGIELILRIRDKIVGDVGMKDKIELREKIKDKIEFEKDVK